MSTSNNLVLKDLFVYAKDKPLIEDINLTLEKDKIYTVIGPSGTGKSTLLKVLAGLLPYDQGQILEDNSVFEPRKKVIGLVPQNYGLLPWETAYETVASNVKISQKKRHLAETEKAMIDELFTALELDSVKKAYPSQMSGGQQQRVSLARGFAIYSQLLLLDEPFSALDSFTREKTQELFFKTWEKRPVTAVFVTHDIEEALLLGHEVIIMKGNPGKIQRVFANPLTKYATLKERKETAEFYPLVTELKKELVHE